MFIFRPFAAKCTVEKLDFDCVLTASEEQLSKLPFDGDRANQPLFHRLKALTFRDENECFFLPSKMGEYTFDCIVRTVGRSCGLLLHPLQCANQALRYGKEVFSTIISGQHFILPESCKCFTN